MNAYHPLKPISNEDLDIVTLEAAKGISTDWIPDDDAWCPTEYGHDTMALVKLFRIDFGPDHEKWSAITEWSREKDLPFATEKTPELAICRAVANHDFYRARKQVEEKRPFDDRLSDDFRGAAYLWESYDDLAKARLTENQFRQYKIIRGILFQRGVRFSIANEVLKSLCLDG